MIKYLVTIADSDKTKTADFVMGKQDLKRFEEYAGAIKTVYDLDILYEVSEKDIERLARSDLTVDENAELKPKASKKDKALLFETEKEYLKEIITDRKIGHYEDGSDVPITFIKEHFRKFCTEKDENDKYIRNPKAKYSYITDALFTSEPKKIKVGESRIKCITIAYNDLQKYLQ